MKLLSMITMTLAWVSCASAAEPVLPAGLHCTAETKNAIAANFKIHALNTDRPGTNIDASIEGPVVPGLTVTTFNGNNGCDNNYDWVFFTDDLTALAQRKVESIPGLMKFSNADSECADKGCEQTETARIVCHSL